MGNRPATRLQHQGLEPNHFSADPLWFWLDEDPARWPEKRPRSPPRMRVLAEPLEEPVPVHGPILHSRARHRLMGCPSF
jgi:hypothetical protein